MNIASPGLKLDSKVVYRLLADEGTFATVLHIIAIVAYGPEVYAVDSLEVILELASQFNVELPHEHEEKLKAILLATSTDAFYDDPEALRGIAETLNSGDPGIDLLDTLTIPELLFAIYEVELNHGPGEFTPAVQSIIDQVLSSESLDPEEMFGDDVYENVWGYLQEMHQHLSHQLVELGVNPRDIPPVDNPTFLDNNGAQDPISEISVQP